MAVIRGSIWTDEDVSFRLQVCWITWMVTSRVQHACYLML